MPRPPWLWPALVAAVPAAAYVAIEPHNIDLAAHTYRAELFGREGPTIWNGQWYAGHHTPAYSVLFPPLAWLLGPTLVGALAAVAGAALFEPLARGHFGDRARWGSLWFGVGATSNLFTGRLPFALGVAIGLGALLALQRRRPRTAAALAVVCSLASPVAGLFLALAGLAYELAGRNRGLLRRGGEGAIVAGAAMLPPVALAVAFPGGGYEPFHYPAFRWVPVFAIGALLLLPRRERALRLGVALYGLATVAAYVIETPMGANAVRLGALFGGPVLACALAGRAGSAVRRAALAVPLAALALWQLSPAVREFGNAIEDETAEESYYEPLLGFLARQDPRRGRLEIPLTSSHWEAAVVAPRFPIVRGWERQLDARHHALFYDGSLTASTYERWLRANGVRFVALSDSRVDYSARQERRLVERGLPYLRPRWRSRQWRVYEVTEPAPIVAPEGSASMSLAELESDQLRIDVRRPGGALVRVHWSPYWQVDGGCVERSGEWTRLIADRPGRLRIRTSFSPKRVVSRGRRCGRGAGKTPGGAAAG